MSLKITPTILLSELYFPLLKIEGEFARIIERVAEEQFYRAVEIGTISSQLERNQIKSIVEAADLTLTHWMTDIITEEELDLSSSNQKKRTEAVNRIIECLHISFEVGAENIALISGLNYEGEVEKDSLDGFYESLCEISKAADNYKMTVLVEPLDKYAHKKRFIGSSKSLFKIIQKVKQSHENIGIAFDTAHSALNRESIEESLSLVLPCLEQIHFSNAVLEPNHELYGDRHMRIGSPGFMTEARIRQIMKKLAVLHENDVRELRVSIEMRTPNNQEIQEYEKYAKDLMNQIKYTVS